MDIKARLGMLTRAPPSGASTQQLDELRGKMAALLEKTALPRAASLRRPTVREVPSGLEEFSLARFTTPHGELFRRVLRVTERFSSHDLDLREGARIAPELLAQLSLDARVAAASPARALYLDCETTGLGLGAGTFAFLVGLAYFDDQEQLWVEQLLLPSPSCERALLHRLRECVERASFLVTFNGKAFDWPLLGARHVMAGAEPLPCLPHVDLLHLGRRLHRSRLDSFNLKRLEREVLGFHRGEDIDGSEVAARYRHFLLSGDSRSLGAVVEHNHWDVLSMVGLLTLYGAPFERLVGSDLLDLARVFERGGHLRGAEQAIDCALNEGMGGPALAVRGRLAKLRGDKVAAVHAFEESLRLENEPRVRLELAKLYEHFLKDPAKALGVMPHQGAEPSAVTRRRQERLLRKLQRTRSLRQRRDHV